MMASSHRMVACRIIIIVVIATTTATTIVVNIINFFPSDASVADTQRARSGLQDRDRAASARRAEEQEEEAAREMRAKEEVLHDASAHQRREAEAKLDDAARLESVPSCCRLRCQWHHAA